MFHYQLVQKGEAHTFNALPCQDAVATHSHHDVICTALSDGVSACRYGGEAAQELASMVAILFAMNFDAYARMSDEALRSEVISVIRAEQRRLAMEHAMRGEPAWLPDMGATLALVAYNKRSRAYIALNLGDGAVLARRAGHTESEMLLSPVRINMNGRMLPVVTAYDDSLLREHLCIRRGNGEHDAFLLSSDGLEGVLFDGATGAISPSVEELMQNMVVDPCGVKAFFPQAVAALHCDDDVSLSAMVHRPPVEDTFINHDAANISEKVKRKARQLTTYGMVIYATNEKKYACRKAGIRYKNKREWRKLQARLKAVGFDD